MRVVACAKWLGYIRRLGHQGPDLAEFSCTVKA